MRSMAKARVVMLVARRGETGMLVAFAGLATRCFILWADVNLIVQLGSAVLCLESLNKSLRRRCRGHKRSKVAGGWLR